MFGLGTPELLIILGIAFFVFGGKKLPEIGAGLGKAIASFKRGLAETSDEGKKILSQVPGVDTVNKITETTDKIAAIGGNTTK